MEIFSIPEGTALKGLYSLSRGKKYFLYKQIPCRKGTQLENNCSLQLSSFYFRLSHKVSFPLGKS